ncbi:MAG: efflux RND transporter permease subunit [Bacteroidota bacterium]
MTHLIRWMATNRVAANLLMLTLLCVGLASVFGVKQQTFPDITLDAVQVRVEYPGATPEEVEASVVQRVEDRIEGIEGIDQITSVASENVGTVTAELQRGAETTRVLEDIKAEVDRITTFPAEAEKPEVRALVAPSGVLKIALYGEAPERTLKELAERVKDDLTATDEISLVEVQGARPYEVSIEVSEATLQAYNLTLLDVATTVRRASLDLPGGSVETSGEDILIRTKAQNYSQQDFEEILLVSRSDGTQIRLGDVATVKDAFQDTDRLTRFNGQAAVFVHVSRTGDERTLDVADRVRTYLEEDLAPVLPAGLSYGIWQDESQVLGSRISLLMRNGLQGLILVVFALMLFLNTRLALWTSVGLFISFMGTFGLMVWLDVSVNMLSLFGFILAIGIVVDDAIVVGENIVAEGERGATPLAAAIQGTSRVAAPVTFAVLTTMAAFTPLLLVPGTMGKLVRDVPTIVIGVLVLSLIEVFFILPKHLSHATRSPRGPLGQGLSRAQAAVTRGLHRFVNGPLERSVRFSVQRYGLVLATAVALLTISLGVVLSGHIKFSFFPQIEGDAVRAQIELAPGSPVAQTQAVTARVEAAGQEVAGRLQETLAADHPPLIKNVFVRIGEASSQGGGAAAGSGQAHMAEVSIELVGAEERGVSSRVFEEAWRAELGEIPEARRLTIASEAVQFGSPVEVELSADDPAVLRAGVEALKTELRTFTGVLDVADDQEGGKRELQLDLRPHARALGLTVEDLARQVRAAYFGEEALRVQRGSEEVRVYVRLPEDERDALGDLNQYRIRTPQGGAVPLYEVATVDVGTGPASVKRRHGRSVVAVTANVDAAVVTGSEVTAKLTADVIPQLQDTYPGLVVRIEGEQREQTETLGALAVSFSLALFLIYVLLAIPLGSYVQPFIIMAAVPFGIIGALIGHLLFGLQLGMMSIFGLIGLSGVVINDSLVLVDFINEKRREGLPMTEAIVQGTKVRFRPILLTTVTTFLGILPLILERSVQAQFLIPMAVSLGFGILFTTVVILMLVPALATLQHDLVGAIQGTRATTATPALKTHERADAVAS